MENKQAAGTKETVGDFSHIVKLLNSLSLDKTAPICLQEIKRQLD